MVLPVASLHLYASGMSHDLLHVIVSRALSKVDKCQDFAT